MTQTSSAVTIRTRYAESDQMWFIHHSNHIIWFEAARMQLFQCIGVQLAEQEDQYIFLPVLAVQAQYHQPAFFNDILEISARFTGCSRVRIWIEYAVCRGGDQLLCEGGSEHVFIRRPSGKPIRIPEWIAEKISAILPAKT